MALNAYEMIVAMSMRERLVSEAIKPVVATCDTARMAAGEPGLPEEFVWRGQTVKIVAVLRTWRETGKCRHGSAERYVRKHWFEVDTASFGLIKIYFDRQPRGSGKSGRWWLFSIRGSQEVQQEAGEGAEGIATCLEP